MTPELRLGIYFSICSAILPRFNEVPNNRIAYNVDLITVDHRSDSQLPKESPFLTAMGELLGVYSFNIWQRLSVWQPECIMISINLFCIPLRCLRDLLTPSSPNDDTYDADEDYDHGGDDEV